MDGIRRTLDSFMKKQDAHNDTLGSTLDKFRASLEKTCKVGIPQVEDMGSNMKGKHTNPHAKPANPVRHTHKSTHFGQHMYGDNMQYYTPSDTGKAQFMYNTGVEWSTMGHASGHQDVDWGDCPWDEQELEVFYELANQDQGFQPEIPNQQGHNAPFQHQNRNKPIAPQDQTQFARPSPNTFAHQLHHQQRAVARGSKLSFPEFDGSDPDGWIRKAEFFF